MTCQSRLRGRSDQRFCSDYCRNRYHNGRKKHERSYFRKINQILHRNRNILYQLASGYRTRVAPEELEAFGFNFSYCTAWQSSPNQEMIYVCYDLAYQRVAEEIRIFHFGRVIPAESSV